jgi:hypothetical protein
VKRTGRLRAVSSRRRALNVRRRAAELALYEAAPFCAMCGHSDVPLSGHERLARSQGGHPDKPDMLLCGRCQVWCEDNPRVAALNGWKISKKWAPLSDQP